MVQKIKNLFKGKPFPLTKHIIKPAFDVAGVKYYEFDTTANLPYKRGLKFISIYNEMDMKVDKFYLEQHAAAMDKLMSGKIGLEELSKAKQLNNQLKERLQFVVQEDLIYKLASVVFFDDTENPDDWEWKYAAKKIEFWKRHESALTFFLHAPIQRLIPFLNVVAENLETFSQAEKAIDEAQLESILQILLPGKKMPSLSYTQRWFSAEMKAKSMS